MSRNKWAVVVGLGLGLVLLAGALTWYGANRPAVSPSAEAHIRDILLAQYTRPVEPDAEERLVRAHPDPDAEVARELARMREELRNDQQAMANRGAAYRSSQVRIRFRSLHANGTQVYAVAEVLADWYWGYNGKPTETPTQVYRLHEFRLTQTGRGWQVDLHRSLASSPTTQVQVAPEPWSD